MTSTISTRPASPLQPWLRRKACLHHTYTTYNKNYPVQGLFPPYWVRSVFFCQVTIFLAFLNTITPWLAPACWLLLEVLKLDIMLLTQHYKHQAGGDKSSPLCSPPGIEEIVPENKRHVVPKHKGHFLAHPKTEARQAPPRTVLRDVVLLKERPIHLEANNFCRSQGSSWETKCSCRHQFPENMAWWKGLVTGKDISGC